MPADDKKEIEAAKSASSLIASLASSLPKQSKAIDDDFKQRKKPLSAIQSDIKDFGKEADGCEAKLDEARKALAAVQKCKTPAAGEAAKKLQAALKDAEKVLQGMKPNAELFHKVWERCSTAQQQLRTQLQAVAADVEKALKTLVKQQRDLKDQTEALRKEVEAAASAPRGASSSAAAPAASLKKPLETLTEAARQHNAELAGAEGLDRGIESAIKGQEAAHDTEVVKLVADTRSLRTELQRALGGGKALVKQALVQLQAAKELLKAAA